MSKTEQRTKTNTNKKVVVENYYRSNDKKTQIKTFNEMYAQMINAKIAKL